MKLKRMSFPKARWLVLLVLWPTLFPLRAQTNTNAVTVTAEVQRTNGVKSVTTVVSDFEKHVSVSFGLNRIPALQAEVFGFPLWQYLASFIYVLLAFYCSKVLDFVVGGQLRRWAARTKTKLDDLLIDL